MTILDQLAIVAFGLGVMICAAVPFWLIWWHRRRHIGPERTELDNDQAAHRRPVSRDIWDGF